MLLPLDREEQQSEYLSPSVQWRIFLKLHAPLEGGANDVPISSPLKTLGRNFKHGSELPIVITDRLCCNLNWKPHTKKQNNIWFFVYKA